MLQLLKASLTGLHDCFEKRDLKPISDKSSSLLGQSIVLVQNESSKKTISTSRFSCTSSSPTAWNTDRKSKPTRLRFGSSVWSRTGELTSKKNR